MKTKRKMDHFKTMKLQRTGCDGNCPVYKLSIHYKGRVTYTGIDCVEKKGRYIWQLDTETIKKLNGTLIESNYFDLKRKEVDTYLTDMPFCITTIELMNGDKRKIEHYLQPNDEWPLCLLRFERQVCNLAGLTKWVGVVND